MQAPYGEAERTWWKTGLLYAAWLMAAVFFLAPIVWSVANSFKPAAAALADPVSLFSQTFSIENYRRLETVGAGWYTYAFNSVLIAIGTIVLTVAVAVPVVVTVVVVAHRPATAGSDRAGWRSA